VKILIPMLALFQLSAAHSSLVAVMDSGTDISHKDLAPKAWVNLKEKAGSTVDLDQDGLPGDINGWDFIANSFKVFDNRYTYLINDDVKKFYDLYGKYDQGLLSASSPEIAWLRQHSQDAALMNKVNFIGGYIHGTHVAGISLKDNPNAKVLSMKVIPTVYQELTPANPNQTKTTQAPVNEQPTKTFDQFKAQLVDDSTSQVEEMIRLHNYVNFHRVDVVNQSFGIGYGDAENFIKASFRNDLKRDPTDIEMKILIKTYFNNLLKEGPRMFAAAPNSLFIIAAGNDHSDNDAFPDYPADIQAENKIVVAATLGFRKLADFSNFGATKVDIAAPGVSILSTAPTNTYIALSGTSQATPYVTNVIALMKDLNPSLSVRDIKAILFGTVDVKSWLKGKVKTSGIINKARALKAAELAKSSSIDKSIADARQAIADTPTMKSFNFNNVKLDIAFKPLRPSLLVKQVTE
jgi:subtilisin family serine protease